jgi:hypothetical protein
LTQLGVRMSVTKSMIPQDDSRDLSQLFVEKPLH